MMENQYFLSTRDSFCGKRVQLCINTPITTIAGLTWIEKLREINQFTRQHKGCGYIHIDSGAVRIARTKSLCLSALATDMARRAENCFGKALIIPFDGLIYVADIDGSGVVDQERLLRPEQLSDLQSCSSVMFRGGALTDAIESTETEFHWSETTLSLKAVLKHQFQPLPTALARQGIPHRSQYRLAVYALFVTVLAGGVVSLATWQQNEKPGERMIQIQQRTGIPLAGAEIHSILQELERVDQFLLYHQIEEVRLMDGVLEFSSPNHQARTIQRLNEAGFNPDIRPAGWVVRIPLSSLKPPSSIELEPVSRYYTALFGAVEKAGLTHELTATAQNALNGVITAHLSVKGVFNPENLASLGLALAELPAKTKELRISAADRRWLDIAWELELRGL